MEYRLTAILFLVFTTHVFGQCGYSITETTTYVSCDGWCDGTSTITVTGGVSPYTYLWSTGDNTSSVINLCGGNYSVTVSDVSGCDSVYTIKKVINPEPILINLTTINVVCGFNGRISASPTGGYVPYKYLFTGNSDSLDSPFIGDLQVGSYTLSLIDSLNCSVDTTFEIVEITCLDPVLPEAFSPNGDGLNDFWGISNLNYFQNYRIYVYSRWGQLVFDSNNDTMPWKGEGVIGTVPAATFYYIMVLDQTDENSKILKGSVSVVR